MFLISYKHSKSTKGYSEYYLHLQKIEKCVMAFYAFLHLKRLKDAASTLKKQETHILYSIPSIHFSIFIKLLAISTLIIQWNVGLQQL